MIVHDGCHLCVKKNGWCLRKKIKWRKIAEENDNKIKTKKKNGISAKYNPRQIEPSWAICEWTTQNKAK